MIETISINDREVDLCINAESLTLPEEGRRLFINRQLSAVGKKHYLESEGFIFFDEGRAVSIAAQIVQWTHTDLRAGGHFIVLPCDHLVYVASIQVRDNYILVEKEELLSFEESVRLVRNNPLDCQVAELGKLSRAFEQHKIELKDLRLNLGAGKDNPFLLKRGYTLGELFMLMATPLLCLGLAAVLWPLFPSKEDAPAMLAPAAPMARVRIGADLEAVDGLLAAFAVLLAYNLETIQVQKAAKGYNATATGKYEQAFSLARLEQIASRLQGRIVVQKDNWTLSSSLFKPPKGRAEALRPLAVSFEQYRRFAMAVNADFAIAGISQRRRWALGVIELRLPHPNRATLKQCARLLRQAGLHGQLLKLSVNAQPHGAWEDLNATVEITGS